MFSDAGRPVVGAERGMDAHAPSDRDRLPSQAPDAAGAGSPPAGAGPSPALRLLPWHDDPPHQPGAMATASDATLLYWAPILGPTGALLLHRLAALASADDAAAVTVVDLARMLRVGPHKVTAAIKRLERYDLITCAGPTIAVRETLPTLTDRLLRQLPDLLAAQYLADTTLDTDGRRPSRSDRTGGRS
jgi:hypothetical protein